MLNGLLESLQSKKQHSIKKAKERPKLNKAAHTPLLSYPRIYNLTLCYQGKVNTILGLE